jgi:hypothetical protein
MTRIVLSQIPLQPHNDRMENAMDLVLNDEPREKVAWLRRIIGRRHKKKDGVENKQGRGNSAPAFQFQVRRQSSDGLRFPSTDASGGVLLQRHQSINEAFYMHILQSSNGNESISSDHAEVDDMYLPERKHSMELGRCNNCRKVYRMALSATERFCSLDCKSACAIRCNSTPSN